MRQALSFSATIGSDLNLMKTITVITILALLRSSHFRPDPDQAGACCAKNQLICCGVLSILSLDQFLRFISVPAVFAAVLITSQLSGAGVFH
jgi:hypothetical protein